MADNFKTCEARLRILKRKLDDRNILKEYNEIFKDYKSKKKLLKEYQKKKEIFKTPGAVHYLPHSKN